MQTRNVVEGDRRCPTPCARWEPWPKSSVLLTCLFAGLARLTGIHWLMGFEIVTLLQIGIGGMVLGCFCLLLVLTAPPGRP